ncbi:hypothetical protein ANANG_G00128700 [Anguilla anguilla]|uniref:LRRNT domain-containing protein n=1 Tax=Anguilla anguilla TaxID=7936 RepID=A0A9D3S042_ANGAN|nr:hypothetical protein ANANG_G00128700 [Anguilla anguilla]
MGQLASQTTVSANRIPHGYCQRNRQQVTAMLSEGLVLLWGLLLCAMDGGVGGCECPQATILAQFPPELPHESCCLNYSGSSFASVTWALFSDVRNLEVLDLSDCNITHLQDAAASPAWLREAYLGRNMLRKLPEGFLANATQLRVLDLGGTSWRGCRMTSCRAPSVSGSCGWTPTAWPSSRAARSSPAWSAWNFLETCGTAPAPWWRTCRVARATTAAGRARSGT